MCHLCKKTDTIRSLLCCLSGCQSICMSVHQTLCHPTSEGSTYVPWHTLVFISYPIKIMKYCLSGVVKPVKWPTLIQQMALLWNNKIPWHHVSAVLAMSEVLFLKPGSLTWRLTWNRWVKDLSVTTKLNK